MKRRAITHHGTSVIIAIALLFLITAPAGANAVVPGITGPTFNLETGDTSIDTPDGDALLVWAYGDGTNPVQYPGPTLIVDQGQVVTVNLTNTLSQPVSIVFPGQGQVTDPVPAGSGSPGLLTREAATGGTVSYQFTASQPGTYIYHSGTNTDLQVEMGLIGAIIVRPTGFDQAN